METDLSCAHKSPRASLLGLMGITAPLGSIYYIYILKVLLIYHFILQHVSHASIDIT